MKMTRYLSFSLPSRSGCQYCLTFDLTSDYETLSFDNIENSSDFFRAFTESGLGSDAISPVRYFWNTQGDVSLRPIFGGDCANVLPKIYSDLSLGSFQPSVIFSDASIGFIVRPGSNTVRLTVTFYSDILSLQGSINPNGVFLKSSLRENNQTLLTSARPTFIPDGSDCTLPLSADVEGSTISIVGDPTTFNSSILESIVTASLKSAIPATQRSPRSTFLNAVDNLSFELSGPILSSSSSQVRSIIVDSIRKFILSLYPNASIKRINTIIQTLSIQYVQNPNLFFSMEGFQPTAPASLDFTSRQAFQDVYDWASVTPNPQAVIPSIVASPDFIALQDTIFSNDSLAPYTIRLQTSDSDLIIQEQSDRFKITVNLKNPLTVSGNVDTVANLVSGYASNIPFSFGEVTQIGWSFQVELAPEPSEPETSDELLLPLDVNPIKGQQGDRWVLWLIFGLTIWVLFILLKPLSVLFLR